jgi:hypothetical protein
VTGRNAPGFVKLRFTERRTMHPSMSDSKYTRRSDGLGKRDTHGVHGHCSEPGAHAPARMNL